MAQSITADHVAIKALLELATKILAAFHFKMFPVIFSENIEYRSGSIVQHGREAFISQLKGQLEMMPPISMEHVIERVDITADGLIYAIGTSIITFKSHPDEPVNIPVVSVYRLVPEDLPEPGKICSMTLYEDPTPMAMKLQEIMGGQK